MMSTPKEQDLLKIIGNSLNYPSGDNCQPFFFKIINNEEFEIHYAHSIAEHRVNFGHYASILTLGTLIESLRIQASLEGYRVEVSDFVSDVSQVKWARVRLVKSADVQAEDSSLALAQKIRATDRRLYSAEPLPGEIRSQLFSEVAKYNNLKFYYLDRLSSDLTKNMLDIEEETLKDSALAQDLLKWIRFDKKAARSTLDGMPWPTLGLPLISKPFLKLFKGRPRVYEQFVRMGSTKGNRKSLQKQLMASGGFGWLCAKKTDYQSLADLGSCYFRLWLQLTRQGYGFQPITMAPLSAFSEQQGVLPRDWPETLSGLYGKFIRIMRNDLKLSEDIHPIWGFRTGKITPLSEENRTYRRNLDSFIIR